MLNANITAFTVTIRTNVTLGHGKAVHAGTAMTVKGVKYAAVPDCGGNRAAERYYGTGQDVTCRRCLKALAARAAMLAAAETEAYAELADRDEQAQQAAKARELTRHVTRRSGVLRPAVVAEATVPELVWVGDTLWQSDDDGQSWTTQDHGMWTLSSGDDRLWYLDGPGTLGRVLIGSVLRESAKRAARLIAWQVS
jgi:hypothetical protein